MNEWIVVGGLRMAEGLMKVNLPRIVKKAQPVVFARSEGACFNILDRQIFNLLLAKAYAQLKTVAIHRLTLNELRDMLSVGRLTSMERIRESLERLAKYDIAIDYEDMETGEKHTLRCHYLSFDMCVVHDGWLDYAFDPLLLDHLHDPKVYSPISWMTMVKFQSAYSVKLYEVMRGVLGCYAKFRDFSIAEFAGFMEIGESYVGRFDRMRERVIDPAIAEVNEIAEFELRVDYLRQGRGNKVIGIRFSASPRTASSIVQAAELAMGRDLGKRRVRSDHRTSDLFRGASDAELALPVVLRSDTVEEANRLLSGESDVDVEFSNWSKEFPRHTLANPDAHFLSWLSLKVKRRDDDRFKGIDVDALFANMIPTE